jgi:hypothetical protein
MSATVWQCTQCRRRQLANDTCVTCQRPAMFLGWGGTCPCCNQLITMHELLQPHDEPKRLRPRDCVLTEPCGQATPT